MTGSTSLPAIDNVAVIGAGAWGTALAMVAHRAGRNVTLWAREPEVVEAVENNGENTPFLSGFKLDPNIRVTNALEAAVSTADMVVIVVPSQFLRATCIALAPYLKPDMPVVICSKGVEAGSDKLMSDVGAETLPMTALAVLSGPSFAAEVAADQPTAVVIASDNTATAQLCVSALSGPNFRPYIGDDVIGVELGGAVKNVIAIACGAAHGKGFGANTRAALITRGLAEMTKLSCVVGGKKETMSGLAGLGDLSLTCSSELSRNFSFGRALGKGGKSTELLSQGNAVVEGAANAVSVTELARKLGIEMPICEHVRAVIEGEIDVNSAIHALMSRPLKSE